MDATSADRLIRIDPDYANRRGYDAQFLESAPGDGASHIVDLPFPSFELDPDIAECDDLAGGKTRILNYRHFSLVMHRTRRTAVFTAVNIDGAAFKDLKREPDKWFFDPRLPAAQQLGESFYRDNDLDLGHLVRRLDPCWGETTEAAKAAADDTFHLTNAGPQHKDFNRNKTVWAGVEDYVLKNAVAERLRLCVFSGPVLDERDPTFRGVQLARQYWKVVVMRKSSGPLSATGYLLDQTRMVDMLVSREFVFGPYRSYQVPVAQIESLTHLRFGAIAEHDPLRRSRGLPRELAAVEEIEV